MRVRLHSAHAFRLDGARILGRESGAEAGRVRELEIRAPVLYCCVGAGLGVVDVQDSVLRTLVRLGFLVCVVEESVFPSGATGAAELAGRGASFELEWEERRKEEGMGKR